MEKKYNAIDSLHHNFLIRLWYHCWLSGPHTAGQVRVTTIPATRKLESNVGFREWHLPVATVQHSLVGILFTLGSGGLFVVVFSAYFGRLPILVSFQIMSLVTGIWCAVARSFDSYFAARIVNGIFASLAQAVGLLQYAQN